MKAKTRSKIFQDLVSLEKKSFIETFASEATCYICDKGLHDGFSVTAKNTSSGTLLFCEKHYSLN